MQAWRRRIGSGLLILASAGSIYAGHAAAATPGGITVSPAVHQVDLDASVLSQPVHFRVTNDQGVAQTLHLSVADFNTLGDSGGLVFAGTNPTALEKKYGLAAWAQLSQSSVTVPANSTVSVVVNILNAASLTPGGHYGALMLAVDSGQSGSGANVVSLNPVAASLLFVTKIGGDTHHLVLTSAAAAHSLFSLPSVVTLGFQNTGNTHLVPRGVVTLYHGSSLIRKGIVNEDSAIILPESTRLYAVPLKSLSGLATPGTYTLQIEYRFDGYDQFRTYRTTILYIPLLWVGAGILLLALLAVGVVVWLRRSS